MQTTIDVKCEFIKKHKLSQQPYIIAVGQLTNISHFFVIINNTKYKFISIVMAVDFCFKLTFVLNLKYSPYSCQIWTFVQKYFYNINTIYDETFSSVTAALSDLKLVDM